MPSLAGWMAQCSGGLAFLVVLCLSIWVLTNDAVAVPQTGSVHSQLHSGLFSSLLPRHGFWTLVFAYYCLVIHLCAISFSTRSCWGIWDMIKKLRDMDDNAKLVRTIQSSLRPRRPSSVGSLSSAETLLSSPSVDGFLSPISWSNSELGDSDYEKFSAITTPATETLVHAIIVPNYKEDLDTLTETLDVLASHPQARDCYDVSSSCWGRANVPPRTSQSD